MRGSISNGFKVDELDYFTKNLVDLANKEMPKECRKFMNKEGIKLRKIVREKSKVEVNKVTSEYQKNWKKGRAYKYRGNGAFAIRVYNASRHAHFIEHGRRVISKEGERFIEGNHLLENAAKNFKTTFTEDTENFVDDLLKLGLS